MSRHPARFTRLVTRVLAFVALAACVPGARAAAQSGAWERQSTPGFAWLRSVDFIDAKRGWAAGGGGVLLRTTDGGATWRRMKKPTDDALRAVRFLDELHGWLLCEPEQFSLKNDDEPRSYVLRTADGGATWARSDPLAADPSLRLTGIAFESTTRGWAFGELGSLYRTADGGATWTRAALASRHLLLDATFTPDGRGWLVGAGAWRTEDDGATWRASRFDQLVTTNTNGGARANVGAASSTPAGAGGRLYAVSFADARRGWAVGANGRILATANGGVSWTSQKSNTDADLLDVQFLDSSIGWAVGAEGTLLTTTNGGRVWARERTATTHRLESLAIVAGGHAWAVGFGGTILHRTPGAPAPVPRLNGVR